jgi:hypothetical protein
MKHSNLYLGLVLPSGGWQSLIPFHQLAFGQMPFYQPLYKNCILSTIKQTLINDLKPIFLTQHPFWGVGVGVKWYISYEVIEIVHSVNGWRNTLVQMVIDKTSSLRMTLPHTYYNKQRHACWIVSLDVSAKDHLNMWYTVCFASSKHRNSRRGRERKISNTGTTLFAH